MHQPRTGRPGDGQDCGQGDLDERQRAVRDHAYRRAYRVLQVVLAMFMVAAWSAGPRLANLSAYQWLVVLTGLGWATLVLPTVVVAWTEPVDSDDQPPARPLLGIRDR